MNYTHTTDNKLSLKAATTFRIGGMAKYHAIINTLRNVMESVRWANTSGIPWFILGGGSNILVDDDGFPGLVITLSGDFKTVRFDEHAVEIGAGVLLPVMSRRFLERRWGGFEFMCDIPGTIGAAVRINAGTKQGEIADHFISAMILTPQGEVRSLCKDDMQFTNRHSTLSETRAIVLSARFALPYLDEQESIREKMRHIKAVRRQAQPKIRRNCGSVFKNPLGLKPAGWYIEQAGLKGMRIGDAMVAHEHGNWIVNLGNAQSTDVKGLIERIQGEVLDRFGVKLEREVIFIPDDIL